MKLSTVDLMRLIDSIDSHVYWQLSEESFRRDGHVLGNGAEEPGVKEEIRMYQKLGEKLHAALAAQEG